MSNDKVHATYHPEYASPPSSPSPRKRRRWVWPTVAVLALLAGVGIGTTSQPTPPTVTKYVAGPTTTQRIPGPTVTVEKKVKVLQTPDVCVKALDAGEKVISIAGDGFTIVSEILNAASQLDVQGMDAGNKKLNDLQPSLVSARQEYDSLSASCKASGS